jgi:hypothetical protein
VKCFCRATEGGGTAAFGLTAAQAGAMGVPAAGPVTSTSGATRIVLLVNCVKREDLLDEECASHCLHAQCSKGSVVVLSPEDRIVTQALLRVLGLLHHTAGRQLDATFVYCRLRCSIRQEQLVTESDGNLMLIIDLVYVCFCLPHKQLTLPML